MDLSHQEGKLTLDNQDQVKEALQVVVELVHPIQDQVLHQVQAQVLGQTIKDRMAKLRQDSQALMAKMDQVKSIQAILLALMHKQNQDKMDKEEVPVVKYSYQDKVGQMAKTQINPRKEAPQALDKMGPAVANLDLAKLHKDLKVVQINQGQVSQMVGKVASLK